MPTIRHALLSDVGLRHTTNDDRAHADPERGLYLVSDGMGEAKSAQLVVDTLPGLLAEAVPADADLTQPDTAARVKQAIATTGRQVRDARRADPSRTGATLVLALMHGDRALLAHVGDSRIYRCRAGNLEWRTRDHSRVQRMLDLGWITEGEALLSLGNGGPTRFLGMAEDAVADVCVETLAGGDRLLLCSDGLTEMLTDQQIEAVLRQAPDTETACRRLVAAANAAGGRDNVTVLLLDVAETG